MRIYKRGDIWWTIFYDQGGTRHRTSTKCHDKKAAETIAKQLERDFADPEATIAREATLSQALRMLVEKRLEQARMGKRSFATAEMYRKKSGHLVRLLEHVGGLYVPMPLAKLTATHVDRYIATRTDEGAAGNTITKELVTLRAALKVAARARLWNGNLLALMPAESVSDYTPRTRWLPEAEVNQLLAQLTPDHAARVAFIVATSANRNETELARREHISADHRFVQIHGTKTAWRSRVVPMASNVHARYLEFALRHADGSDGMLFRKWGNMNRDLAEACERAGIARCSPNDLRRTCATWLRNLGLPPDLIAAVLGHRDTRMVERVYGRLAPEFLEQRMLGAFSAAKSASEDCDTGVSNSVEIDGKGGKGGRSENVNTLKPVPRDGIEPPTRGFSVPCSTD
jgi:integrase